MFGLLILPAPLKNQHWNTQLFAFVRLLILLNLNLTNLQYEITGHYKSIVHNLPCENEWRRHLNI